MAFIKRTQAEAYKAVPAREGERLAKEAKAQCRCAGCPDKCDCKSCNCACACKR